MHRKSLPGLLARRFPAAVCLPLLLALIWLPPGAANACDEPLPAVGLPVFPGGFGVVRHRNIPEGGQSVRYTVAAAPPAAAILQFYDVHFNSEGWLPAYETCQRQWGTTEQAAPAGSGPVQILVAHWRHPALPLRAALKLTHRSPAAERPHEVIVDCRLLPFNPR
jgi:hypothetical protein